MVARIAAKKSDDTWFADYVTEMDNLRADFLRLVDDDSAAYGGVMEAMKLPKTNDDEKRERTERIQAALLAASRVPLEVAKTSRRLLDACERGIAKSTPATASDIGVGALMAEAALRGASLNVMINLASVKDLPRSRRYPRTSTARSTAPKRSANGSRTSSRRASRADATAARATARGAVERALAGAIRGITRPRHPTRAGGDLRRHRSRRQHLPAAPRARRQGARNQSPRRRAGSRRHRAAVMTELDRASRDPSVHGVLLLTLYRESSTKAISSITSRPRRTSRA